MQNQDRVEDHLNDQQYCCNILVLKFSSPPKIDAISVYCSLFPLLPNRMLSIFLQPLTSGNHVDANWDGHTHIHNISLESFSISSETAQAIIASNSLESF